MNHKIAASLVALTLLGPVACGSDDNSTAAESSTTQPSADQLTVDDAWARTSPANAQVGAAYFTINGGPEDDKLTGVSVDASVAGEAQIHEMSMADDMAGESTGEMDGAMDGDAGMHASGASGTSGDTADDMAGSTSTTKAPAMQMQQVDSVDVPAGEMVAFAPGAYHIMLMQLAEPLATGDEVKLDLEFEKAGTIEVTAEVKEAP